MNAGIITAAGKAPVYGDFNEPVVSAGQELITVSASATESVQQVPIFGLPLQFKRKVSIRGRRRRRRAQCCQTAFLLRPAGSACPNNFARSRESP